MNRIFASHRLVKSAALLGLFLSAIASLVQAAPFAKQIQFQQPGGITINLWGQGDDFHAVFETLDGYTVVFDPPTNTYFYATLSADGTNLVPMNMPVGNGNPQALGLAKHLRITADATKQQAAARFQRWEQGMQTGLSWKALKAERRALDEAAKNNPQAAPPTSTTTGAKTGLCLLIDFSDDPSTISQPNIDSFCNGDSYTGYGNNGSVKKYFSDNSNGTLTYTNVVTAYIRMARPKSYYNDTSVDCGTQGNLLIQDAIAIMRALPNYTTDILPLFDDLTVAGGNVVACNVFFAGGDSGVWSYGLWPHSWSLYDVGAQELSAGGKKVFKYQITNIGSTLTLGTFCHENGHMLCGFPDIYDYDYDSVGGAGDFCLMDYGGDGGKPSQVCAYLKRAAGWATVTDITSASALTASVTATNGAPGFNHFYRYAKPGVSTEYFLIENRQKSGRDAGLPASGIAVWHVDELGDRDNQSIVPNSSHANYEVTLEQADNQWHFQNYVNGGDAQDLYYAGNGAAAYTNIFSDSSTPNAHWWSGSNSGMILSSISASGPTMTFKVGNPDVNDPNSFTAVVADASRINLSWLKNPSNSNVMVAWNTTSTFGTPTGTYSAGGTIAGGGTVLYNGSATSIMHSGLVVGTTYYYKAWSVLSGPAYSTGVTASAVAGVEVVILTEGFENGGNLPAGWTQSNVTNPLLPWTFQNGGSSGYGYPASAHGGSYNASLYYEEATDHRTKLVSPAMNFGPNILKTQLRFWHCMPYWNPDQDELRVYYRTSLTGTWMLLKTYTIDTSSWTARTIDLPDPGSTYYIAFDGNAKYGFGVSIDDVQVVGMTPSDTTPPTVTINQAPAQTDPTNVLPINFTVVFSEAVTDFATGDVTISGTAPGTKTATVTGSGTTYNVAVNGVTGSGTVIATIAGGAAHDAADNPNAASTSTDNTVTYDISLPTVTINQKSSGQADPTNTSPINFTVVFNKPVADFATGDVTITGSAPGTMTATVTGSGTTYDVAVSGMTGSGTVIAELAAGVAHDSLGYANVASTSTDNTVTYDIIPPTVTINRAGDQPDPTNSLPINFTVVFSKEVTDFATGDVTITGTANGEEKFGEVTGSGTTYNVAVGGLQSEGTVIVSLAAGVAYDLAGNGNIASTSTDNLVLLDGTPPSVTINQTEAQADPTNGAPINFTVVFSEAVADFATGDVTISGTAPGTMTATVTGSGTDYNVAVNGMEGNGTVIAEIAYGVAQDAAGNGNNASTSTDNSVFYGIMPPTVTINQAAAQADPAYASPINFTVEFSEAVTDFATGDVTITGTAPGAMTATVSGSGTTYNVAVSGMTGNGTVIADIAAGVAHDAPGNANVASTSTDHTVDYISAPTVTINQAVAQADPTKTSPINFSVVFSRAVTGFTTGDVTISGTAAGSKTATVTGSGTTYNVAVSNVTGTGTVIATIAANVAQDALLGTLNVASTSTDNVVTYDITPPTVTINQALGQADPTNASPINFTVVFSEEVTGFATGDVTFTGTAAGTKVGTVTGSGTTYNVAVSGVTGGGTVIAAIAANAAQDLAGNLSAAATFTDRTVTYDIIAPTATITQASGQTDPTKTVPISFTVVFSEAVTDFAAEDVTISGTAPGTRTATVTGSSTTYNVAVSGMTGSGTVVVALAAGVAHDAAGNGNTASINSDNTVTYDITPPTVTINQAAAQTDPTNGTTINFTVVFSKTVTGFIASDVTISGTAAGTKTATVTGSGATYTVAVKGMSGTGTVIATIDANKAQDALGNLNAASTSTDNSVTYDVTAPSVTINQAAAQADPSNSPALNFTAVFSEPVTGFATGDVTVSGTTGGTKTATVTGSGTTYNVAVTGMTSGGTVTVAIASARATDLATNSNTAATFTDNTVTYDIIAPTVTINKTAGQTEPLSGSPINFTVVFSETVTDFATGDVIITGAGTGTATVTGSDKNYTVAVSGMAGTGTVAASLAAGVAHDAAGNDNAVSTSTDNTVDYTITLPTVTINQAVAQADPTMDMPVNFTVVFSKSVTNFATGDVSFEGSTAPGIMTGTVTGSGMNYTVAVSGMTGPGTVMATLAAGMAQDSLGNLNAASTSTDNSVTYAPTGMPSWRQQYFGTNVSEGDADDAADPNKNGIVNLLEYALGGDPVGGTTGTSILPKAGMSADGHLQLSLIRTLDRSDITLVVQGSSSMTGTWTDLARSTGGAAFTALIGGVTVNESGSGATRMVKIDDLYPTTDPAHPCRFMRLCVTNP